ncbi:MAG TPA: hypothetical protein VEZ15_15710, partial [Acidimicrobiia bacterium]|nr:hypothetical protein [Acidimicrobiia bacterium]
MRFVSRVVVAGVTLVTLVAIQGTSAAPSPSRPPTRQQVVRQWSRFEASYEPSARPVNPFDPDEIDVRAVFFPPDHGPIEVVAFWFQDYARSLVGGREHLTPKGAPHFLMRLTPETPGLWRWHWVIRQRGRTTYLGEQYLRVTPAKGHGFLRVSKRDPRYLAFDDGAPYFAVGENTGWYDARGTYAYDDWFGALAKQHANFGRIWMSSWAFGIEWNDTGLGNYSNRLDRAWQLDRVLDEADHRDIYVMISLLNHGAFSTVFNSEWANNPYNAVNGGPLSTPAEFFTNSEARKLFEQRLRYIVARWGWSTHVQSWELWNEVDLTDRYNSAAVASWHAEMTARLHALDPYDHLVTTSHAIFAADPSVWKVPGLDFTQLHYYADTFPQYSNLSKTVMTWTADRSAVTGKPVVFGELGVDSRGPAETSADDPQGIGLHDGLWAGVVSGDFGTAMPWWWDNLIAAEPNRYYPMFGSVATFVARVPWDREAFHAARASVAGSSRPV